jgi:hypothetical protein
MIIWNSSYLASFEFFWWWWSPGGGAFAIGISFGGASYSSFRFPLALALVRLRSPFGHLALVLALALLPVCFFLQLLFLQFFISIITSIASSRFFYFCSFSCCFSSFSFSFCNFFNPLFARLVSNPFSLFFFAIFPFALQ